MSTTTDDAITKGVMAWLDANKTHVSNLIMQAMSNHADAVAEGAVAGAMLKVGKFLDDNKDYLVTSIAVAIAQAWTLRQHPPVSSSTPISEV